MNTKYIANFSSFVLDQGHFFDDFVCGMATILVINVIKIFFSKIVLNWLNRVSNLYLESPKKGRALKRLKGKTILPSLDFSSS